MRILFVSDLHFPTTRAWEFEEVVETENYDIILSGGDVDEVPDYLEDYPFYTIYGNHDWPDELAEKTNLLSNPSKPAGANVSKIDGLVVCSMGGAIIRDNFGYTETWHTPEEYMEGYRVILELLRKKYGRCDVFLTHESPRAIVEYEWGRVPQNNRMNIDMKAYRMLFDTFAVLFGPRIYLCGHVHSTSATLTHLKNYDVYMASAKNIPVLKAIFVRDNTYTIIDTDAEKICVRRRGKTLKEARFEEEFIIL